MHAADPPSVITKHDERIAADTREAVCDAIRAKAKEPTT
jgi:hypothetical protein